MILGQGAFGRVVKAEAIGIQDGADVTTVAVKMVKGKLCQYLALNSWNFKDGIIILNLLN